MKGKIGSSNTHGSHLKVVRSLDLAALARLAERHDISIVRLLIEGIVYQTAAGGYLPLSENHQAFEAWLIGKLVLPFD